MKTVSKKLTLLALTLGLLAAPAGAQAMSYAKQCKRFGIGLTFCSPFITGMLLSYGPPINLPPIITVLSPFVLGGGMIIASQDLEPDLAGQEFIDCCKNGNLEKLNRIVLNNGIGIITLAECILYDNNKALRESSKTKHCDVVRILLNNGARIDANNYEAVANALENNHAKTINVLFNHLYQTAGLVKTCYNNIMGESMWSNLSTDTEAQKKYLCILKDFHYYLHIFWDATTPIKLLQRACLLGRENETIEFVQNIVKNQATHRLNINSKDFAYNGDSLLHLAAKANSPDVIKLLLRFGHKLNLKNRDGLTPLQCAQTWNCKEAVDALLTSSTVNFEKNSELQLRYGTQQLLERIPVKTGTASINKKIDAIKYVCSLVQHKHDVQPLLEKLSTIKPETIKNKKSLKGLPVGTILSFIDKKDLPVKIKREPLFNTSGPK